MAWIELHQAVWTHRKTLILADLLGLDPTYAAAHMVRLWTWALDNAPTGDLSQLPDRVIAYGSGWTGEPSVFAQALLESGWLDGDADGHLLIHDWDDYAGRLIEKRQTDAERMRRYRAGATDESTPPSKGSANVTRTLRERNAHVQGTVPNRTVPNLTGEDRTAPGDGEQARTPAPPPDLPDELKDFAEILRPLRGYQPTPEFYSWVRESCTNVDLRAEAIKMVAHAKKKHYAGDLKFVTSWLERAINPPWDDAVPSSRSRANLVGLASPPAVPRPLPLSKPELPPEERQRVNTWKLALERIKSETPDPHLFKAWFGGTRLAACNELTAAIEADEYQLPLLEKNRAKIARALGIDQELVELRARPVPVGASP